MKMRAGRDRAANDAVSGGAPFYFLSRIQRNVFCGGLEEDFSPVWPDALQFIDVETKGIVIFMQVEGEVEGASLKPLHLRGDLWYG